MFADHDSSSAVVVCVDETVGQGFADGFISLPFWGISGEAAWASADGLVAGRKNL